MHFFTIKSLALSLIIIYEMNQVIYCNHFLRTSFYVHLNMSIKMCATPPCQKVIHFAELIKERI